MRVVILGTGTGVGKTHVTAALARALAVADRTAEVLAVKPIETGVQSLREPRMPPNGPSSAPAADRRQPRPGTDAAALELASSAPPLRPHPLYAYEDAVSAHLASRREGRPIRISKIARWLAKPKLPRTTLHRTSYQLIETAGGAFSPITPRLTNADLAVSLGPAIWVLVAPDALGVLHDVRATFLALTSVARAPDYVVLSACRAPDSSTGRNAAELARVGLPRPICTVAATADPVAALRPLARALDAEARRGRKV